MKFPISAYEKLLNNFIPKEFSEVESIEVRHPSAFFEWMMDVVVIVHLKDVESGGSIESCFSFGKKIIPRIMELIKYLSGPYNPEIVIFRGGRKVCGSRDLYVGKK